MTVPLTPPDCDLRDFQFIPIDIGRVFSSEFHAIATDAEWRAGVTLWLKSFHQVPAASLPDDDVQLCRLAELGRDLKTWKGLRAGALHGWVKCDDGRFYHPVVSEKANTAWARKLLQREKSRRANDARWGRNKVPVDASGAVDEPALAIPDASHKESIEDPTRIPERSQGIGRGIGIYSSVPLGTGVPPSGLAIEDPLSEIRALPVAKGCWRMALLVLTERGGMADARARTLVGKLKGGGLSDVDLWSIAEAAWNLGTMDAAAYLTKAAEEAIARNGSGSITAPSERQQRAWMDDWRDKGAAAWKVHERGPRPDQPGCRVAPAILAGSGFGLENVIPFGGSGAIQTGGSS